MKKLASIRIYLSPLRKYAGFYETKNYKDFKIKMLNKQTFKEFINTFYHEMTHVLVLLITYNLTRSSASKTKAESLTKKEVERLCEKVAASAANLCYNALRRKK